LRPAPALAGSEPHDFDLGRIESKANESRPRGQAAPVEDFPVLEFENVNEFQQAKTAGQGSRFLQIVAKSDRADQNKTKTKAEPKLTRVAFKVSRLMEFCTLRELQNQTGHSWDEWALVVLKELMDNALDACEEVEVAPVISISVKDGAIKIRDNGGGIAPATIESILDYTVRVSSREAYVSPTRGAQGNALKTILAMAFVLNREAFTENNQDDAAGVTIIETRGVKHRIEFSVDHINNEPRVTHVTSRSAIKVGTKVTVQWPLHWVERVGDDTRFRELAESYAWVNPHLTLRATYNGETFIDFAASDKAWKKWKPSNPTSAYWYNEARLQRYLAAHVARDRESGRHRTVREFIREFRGLSGSAAQRRVLNEVGCSHQSLAQFFGVEQVNSKGIAKLLAAMRKYTKPVAPKHLGIIGSAHFVNRFFNAGGIAATFNYQQRKGVTEDGIPYVVEFVFGLHQSADPSSNRQWRKIVTGANWSVGIKNPFRTFGKTGQGLESTLAKVRADYGQPVICVLHLASAHIQFADRGKSSIILTDDASQPNE
jgi:DNA topoisomerase VI subunit B